MGSIRRDPQLAARLEAEQKAKREQWEPAPTGWRKSAGDFMEKLLAPETQAIASAVTSRPAQWAAREHPKATQTAMEMALMGGPMPWAMYSWAPRQLPNPLEGKVQEGVISAWSNPRFVEFVMKNWPGLYKELQRRATVYTLNLKEGLLDRGMGGYVASNIPSERHLAKGQVGTRSAEIALDEGFFNKYFADDAAKQRWIDRFDQKLAEYHNTTDPVKKAERGMWLDAFSRIPATPGHETGGHALGLLSDADVARKVALRQGHAPGFGGQMRAATDLGAGTPPTNLYERSPLRGKEGPAQVYQLNKQGAGSVLDTASEKARRQADYFFENMRVPHVARKDVLDPDPTGNVARSAPFFPEAFDWVRGNYPKEMFRGERFVEHQGRSYARYSRDPKMREMQKRADMWQKHVADEYGRRGWGQQAMDAEELLSGQLTSGPTKMSPGERSINLPVETRDIFPLATRMSQRPTYVTNVEDALVALEEQLANRPRR